MHWESCFPLWHWEDTYIMTGALARGAETTAGRLNYSNVLHQRERERWAVVWQLLLESEWKALPISDDTCLSISDPQGSVWNPINDHSIQRRMKLGAVLLAQWKYLTWNMIWAAFSWQKCGGDCMDKPIMYFGECVLHFYVQSNSGEMWECQSCSFLFQ